MSLEKTFLVGNLDGQSPYFVKEPDLTKAHIKELMSKLIMIFHSTSEEARDIFASCMEKSVMSNESFEVSKLIGSENIKKEVQLIFETFFYSPAAVKDLFTRTLLEIRGIHIPEKIK